MLTPEYNYYPVSLEITDNSVPNTNTEPTAITNTNIVVAPAGTILNGGTLTSPNFSAGNSGWRLDSNGNLEANNGNFRGDITGASGTFTGNITATSGTIGGFTIADTSLKDAAGTVGLSSAVTVGDDVRFWAGGTTPTTAPFKVTEAGSVVAADITATGTINAQSGYLSAGVYVDTSNGLVCESEGINVGTAGHIRGGQTAYDTGEGFWLGYAATEYKFSIGNSADSNNLLLWNGTNLIVNGSIIANEDKFGDGSDGALSTPGDVTLTADAYYTNLTVNAGHTFNPAGYRVFCNGILSIAATGILGRVGNDGTSASGVTKGTGGAALAAGFLNGGAAGQDGKDGAPTNSLNGMGAAGAAGTNGGSVASAIGTDGAAGVAGGTGGNDGANPGTPGGAAGVGGVATSASNEPKTFTELSIMRDFAPASSVKFTAFGGAGGTGGSSAGYRIVSGTGGSGGGGGGSGGNGGMVFISAKKIVNAGTITVKGGNGGNGGNGGDATGVNNNAGGGGGSGGSGGSGGVLILCYQTLTDIGVITVAGGTEGAKGTAGLKTANGQNGGQGNDGNTGTAGLRIDLQI